MEYRLTKKDRKRILDEVIEGIGHEAKFNRIDDFSVVDESEGNKVYISVDSLGNIITAAISSKNYETAINYLSQLPDYDIGAMSRESRIKTIRRITSFGVLANALDTLSDLPTYSGYFISWTKSNDFRIVVKEWLRHMNGELLDPQRFNVGGIGTFAQSVLHNIFCDGDYVGIEIWKNVEIPQIGKKFLLPVGVKEFDVLDLELDESYLDIGVERFSLKVSEGLKAIVEGNSDLDEEIRKKILESLSKEIQNQIRNGGTVYLPDNILVRFSRKKINRPGWGKSYFERAIPYIGFKERMRVLDRATIDGLIKKSVIIMVGSDNPSSDYHNPEPERIAFARRVFRDLKDGNILVWGGKDLSILDIGTEKSEIFSFSDRYRDIDRDILMSLGISKFLIDGEAPAGQLDVKMAIKTISMITNELAKITYWVERKMRQIALNNNFKNEFVRFYWKQNDLYDKDITKNKALRLREYALMGVRRVLSEFGYDADEILNEIKYEREEGLDETLPSPFIPFQGRGSAGDKGGRPSGSDTQKKEGGDNKNGQGS